MKTDGGCHHDQEMTPVSIVKGLMVGGALSSNRVSKICHVTSRYE